MRVLWKEPIEGEVVYGNKLDVMPVQSGQRGCRGEVEAGDDNNSGKGFTIKTVHLQLGRGSGEIVHMYTYVTTVSPRNFLL